MGKNFDETALLKSLEGVSDAEKVQKLIKKLADSEKQNTDLKAKLVDYDKVVKVRDLVEKKWEKTQQVLVRTEESKSKLEELCRGLQKANQQTRDECLAKIKKMELEKAQTVEHLKVTLKDIERTMSEGKAKSDSLAEDNKKLSQKFTEIGQQYEERMKVIDEQMLKKEKYWEEYGKAKDLEIKLLNAKLDASSIQVRKAGMEKDELTKIVLEETARVGGALETEKALRDQVLEYSTKYSELTNCLARSNEAFDKFRKEIDRVNAKCSKIEKEGLVFKTKCDQANQKVLMLTMENKELSDTVPVYQKKIQTLENLCRALQKTAITNETTETTTETSKDS
uniref:Alpha-taxilin n=1 Tax=Caenorhabditis tropicalis TaxID=1561998 RepID=A0A1I7T438_9PELO